MSNALLEAVEKDRAVEDSQQYAIPLSRIVGSDNPRQEPAKLATLGYKLVDPKDKAHSLLHMALSEDLEVVKQLVALFEEHENDPPDYFETEEGDENLNKVSMKEDGNSILRRERSIVSLARSMAVIQLQPVWVRKGGGENPTYTLIIGQRRTAARAYSYAKSRLDVANKVKGAKLLAAAIFATETKVSGDTAYEFGVRENFDRKDFTPLQQAAIFYEYTKRTHPETKKPWTLKQVAEHFDLEYGIVRNRRALMLPRVNDKTDDKGNVTKPGKGLTDEDRQKLATGEVTLTWATRRALGEQHYAETGTPSTTRRKGIPLSAMEKLFDDTAESRKDRREAIAQCMGLTLAQAIKESDKRITESENSELKGQKKAAKKTKKGQLQKV